MRGAQRNESSIHENYTMHNRGKGMSRASNTSISVQRRGQKRAATFREKHETFRATKLVEGHRDVMSVREQ